MNTLEKSLRFTFNYVMNFSSDDHKSTRACLRARARARVGGYVCVCFESALEITIISLLVLQMYRRWHTVCKFLDFYLDAATFETYDYLLAHI